MTSIKMFEKIILNYRLYICINMLICLLFTVETYGQTQKDSLRIPKPKLKNHKIRGVFGILEVGIEPNLWAQTNGIVQNGQPILLSSSHRILIAIQPSPYFSFGPGFGFHFFNGFEQFDFLFDARINFSKKVYVPFVDIIGGPTINLYNSTLGHNYGLSVGIKKYVTNKTAVQLSTGLKYASGIIGQINKTYGLPENQFYTLQHIWVVNFGISF